MARINESLSPVVFLYGMAVVLAVSKACMLFIWRAPAHAEATIAARDDRGVAPPEVQ
jgi:hypothetical protein